MDKHHTQQSSGIYGNPTENANHFSRHKSALQYKIYKEGNSKMLPSNSLRVARALKNFDLDVMSEQLQIANCNCTTGLHHQEEIKKTLQIPGWRDLVCRWFQFSVIRLSWHVNLNSNLTKQRATQITNVLREKTRNHMLNHMSRPLFCLLLVISGAGARWSRHVDIFFSGSEKIVSNQKQNSTLKE